MKIVKLIKLEVRIITDGDVESDYIRDLIELAIAEELKHHQDPPMRYVQVIEKECHNSTIVNDDYSLIET